MTDLENFFITCKAYKKHVAFLVQLVSNRSLYTNTTSYYIIQVWFIQNKLSLNPWEHRTFETTQAYFIWYYNSCLELSQGKNFHWESKTIIFLSYCLKSYGDFTPKFSSKTEDDFELSFQKMIVDLLIKIYPK